MRRRVMRGIIAGAVLALALGGAAASGQGLRDSPDAQALIAQALALWDQGKRAPGMQPTDLEAKALLERVVTEYPDTEQAAEALMYLAFGHFFKGMVEDAERLYERLFSEYPTSAARELAWLDRSGLAYSKGDLVAAIGYLEAALRDFPNGKHTDNVKFDLAVYYLARGRPHEALGLFQSVVTEYPQSKWRQPARRYIPRCHQAVGEYAAALAAYDEALRGETEGPEMVATLLHLAECQWQARLYADARVTLEWLLAEPPTYVPAEDFLPAVWWLYAKTFLDEKDISQGLAWLNRGLSEYPESRESAGVTMAGAEYFYQRGMLNHAFLQYHRLAATAVAPRDARAQAYLRLGYLYREWGLTAEAAESFRAAAAVAPDAPAAKDALHQLRAQPLGTAAAPQARLLTDEEMKEVVGGKCNNSECNDSIACPTGCVSYDGASKRCDGIAAYKCKASLLYWCSTCYDYTEQQNQGLWCCQWKYWLNSTCAGTPNPGSPPTCNCSTGWGCGGSAPCPLGSSGECPGY